jgi:hypothetical protein
VVGVAIARRFKIGHDEVFPFGAYLVGEVGPVFDFERSTKDLKVQQVDKDSGLLLWSVEVLGADPEAGKKSKTVKLAAKVRLMRVGSATTLTTWPTGSTPLCHKGATTGRTAMSFQVTSRTQKPLTCRYNGGPRRARTDDLRIKSPQLYQLS